MKPFVRWFRHAAMAATAGAWSLAARAAQAALPTVPTPVDSAAAPAVGAAGLLQAGFGMFAVLGLIFLCAWAARRFGLQRLGSGHLVKVVASTMVGQRERVVVVEVGGQWLVLGVTSNQVNTLHSLPAQAGGTALPVSPDARDLRVAGAANLFAQKLRESLGLKPQQPGR